MSLRRRTWLVCFLSAVVLVVGTADRRLPLLVSSAAAADTVSLDPFEIDLGVARLRVPHLEASGTTLDKAGLTALLDPKSSLGLLERLDKLTAASITASDVTLESADPLGAVRLSYKQITFSDVVRGRIGKLAATGGALGFDVTALKAAIDGGLGDLRIDNLDLGLLARSVTQPRQDAGEPVRALFDHAEFDGFHIKAGDSFAVSTGKWSLADVQLRPLLASTLAGPEVLLQSYLHTDEERSLALGAGFITDLWSSLIVGDAEIRDIAVRFEWDGGRTTYTLSRVHLGGIGRGKFEDMALEGMGFDSPGGRFKLALYAIRGLDLSGVLGPLLEAGKLAERKHHETDSAAAAEDAKAMLAVVADFYDSLSLRATEVRGLDFAAGSGPKATTASLGRYALLDLAHSHLGDLAVEHLHVATPGGHFTVGEFSLHDFDYGPVLKGLKLMAAKAPPSMIEAWRDMLPTLDQFVLAGVDLDVADEKGTGNAGDGKRDVVRLGRFEIDAGRFLRGIPTELTASLDHLALDVPTVTDDALWQRLNPLGITHLDLSTRFDLKWDQVTKELGLRELSIGAPNLGSATLAIKIANLPVEAFTAEFPVAEAAWLAAVVKAADLRLIDVGLFDKEIALEAASDKITPEQRRRDIVAVVATEFPRVLGASAAAADITRAVEAFVRMPKSLHIVARSEQGLGVADFVAMKSVDDLLRRLDVRASADE